MILFVYDLMLITMILLLIPLSSAFGNYSANNCAYCIVMNLLMSIAFGSFKHGNCAYCIVLNLLIFFGLTRVNPSDP